MAEELMRPGTEVTTAVGVFLSDWDVRLKG